MEKTTVFLTLERVLNEICENNRKVSYKVNKTNVSVRHRSSKNLIMDIYFRKNNPSIRVYINSQSPEYREYQNINHLIDERKNNKYPEKALDFAFYVAQTRIENVLVPLINARG